MDDFLCFAFAVKRPSDFAVIKGVTGERSPEELMADLRAEHPEEAMLLGEWIVLPEEPQS